MNRPWVEWTPARLDPSEDTDKDKTAVDWFETTSHEIDGARIQEAGERLKYAFTRKRALFRQSVKLYDVACIESEDFKQYKDPQFKESHEHPGVFGTRYLLRDSANSCVPQTSESSVQTARFRLVPSTVQYAPIVQESDDKAKIKENEELLDMFERVLPAVEHALSTNETVQVEKRPAYSVKETYVHCKETIFERVFLAIEHALSTYATVEVETYCAGFCQRPDTSGRQRDTGQYLACLLLLI